MHFLNAGASDVSFGPTGCIARSALASGARWAHVPCSRGGFRPRSRARGRASPGACPGLGPQRDATAEPAPTVTSEGPAGGVQLWAKPPSSSPWDALIVRSLPAP